MVPIHIPKYDMELEKEKKKSMDGHCNLLKELKENEKDRFIKCLEYMYLVILFKEKKCNGL